MTTRSRSPYWIAFAVVLLALFALFFLNGCGRDEPDPRPDSIAELDSFLADTAPPSSQERTLEAAPPVAPPSDTVVIGVDTTQVPWADTVQTGDTVIVEHSIIRNITTRLAVTTSDVTKVRTDTTTVNVLTGIPLGAFALKNVATWPSGIEATNIPTSPSSIVNDIRALRARGGRGVFYLTGGAHNVFTGGEFMTKLSTGYWQFDFGKWKARMDQYGTQAIRAELARGVQDGTVILSSVMDEPETTGGGDGNGWSKDPNWMTKARVDSLGAYHRKVLPGIPVAVSHGPNAYYAGLLSGKAAWRANERYRNFDAVVVQYSAWITGGDATLWRDRVLQQAQLDGVSVALSMNLIEGGLPDPDANKKTAGWVWDCKNEGGVKGTRPYNCQITATQLAQWGRVFGRGGCAVLMWRYDQTYFGNAQKRTAITDLSNYLARLPPKQCRRTA